MKYIVCVKQVPDTTGKVAVKPDGTINRALMDTIINPDDLNAVEAALSLKDKTNGEVIVLSMGPAQARSMLAELLSMGADKAYLVCGREFAGSDTYATSQILTAAINAIGIDDETVIFCGRQAIDGDTAQVGPQLAQKLGIPLITYAADIKADGNTITVKRKLDDGFSVVQTKMPCLITCIKDLNTPRYMTVPQIMDFDEKPYIVLEYNDLKDDPHISADTIGLEGSPTIIYKSFGPPKRQVGMMLKGNAKEQVGQLFDILSEKHLV